MLREPQLSVMKSRAMIPKSRIGLRDIKAICHFLKQVTVKL
jgi:hypothetical protein